MENRELKNPEPEHLTHEQMNELIKQGNGSFKKLPNVLKIGVIDVQRSANNLMGSVLKARSAYINGFYIEAISLVLQHIDFHLRMYWVIKNKKGKVFDETDKVFFGQLINNCKDVGFNNVLADKIKDFNTNRVKAIHKFALGEIEYNDLKQVCDTHRNLEVEVFNYVRDEIGVSVYSMEDLGNPGDVLWGPF